MVVKDDNDIIRGLGFVALYSAYLEEALDKCLEALQDSDAAAYAKRLKLPAGQKVEYCLKEVAKLGIDQVLPVAEAFKRSGALLKQRNDVVHGRIYSQEFGPDLRRSGRTGVLEREISSAELYELANSLYEVVRLMGQVSCFYIPDAIRNKDQEAEAAGRRTPASTGRPASPSAR
jgi:hypothetical protein